MSVKWNLLNLKYQYRGEQKLSEINPIGLDTETNIKENKCELLCSETGHYIRPNSFTDIINFCFFKTRLFNKSGCVFVFYNLQFDVQSFLKWTDEKTCQILWDTGKVIWDNFELSLIPWKMFSVRNPKQKRKITFFDIAQFFNYLTLDSAAKKYLNKEKLKNVDRTALDFDAQETIDYCIHDAVLAGDLARYILQVHKNHFPESPPSLISKAGVSEKHFRSQCNIPTINNIIKQKPSYIKVAYKTYRGGFFEAFKKGYFPKVYVYDINSAYPFTMSKLPDISEGFFRSCKGEPEPDAKLGWILCDIEIENNQYGYINPLAIDIKNTRFYPWGRYRQYLTLNEYRKLSPYYIIEPVYSVYWVPDVFPMQYPYRNELTRLYEWKRTETDPILKHYIKIVLNSIYGKTIQKVPNLEKQLFNTGNLFNPFYASYITADTRLQIFDVLKRINKESIIMVATDSIMTTEPIPDIDLTDQLGHWGLESTGEAVVLGSGVYSIKTDDNKQITKRRGFKSEKGLNFLETDSLHMIDDSILIPVKNHISLAKSLIQKDFSKMNLILSDTRTLNINFDYRRNWKKRFDNLKKVLDNQIVIDSEPLLIDLL